MKNGFGVVLVTALLLGSVNAAMAADEIINSGSHTNPAGDGLDFTGPGNLTINGGTFNNDKNAGVDSFESTSVTITGGTFDNDPSGGISSVEDSSVSISGGTFDADSFGLSTDTLNGTVSGGLFENNQVGIAVLNNANALVTVTGATFSGNTNDLSTSKGTIDVYGTAFSVGFGDLATGEGTFSWTDNNGFTQTVSYDNKGTIDLIDSAAVITTPEPSSMIGIAIPLGVCALLVGLKCRSSNAAV